MNRVGMSYVLWVAGLFGANGLHRFYNGKVATGILWFCTGGLLGIGQFVDLFLIPGMAEEREAEIRAKLGVSGSGVPLVQTNGAIAMTALPPTREQLMVSLLKAATEKGGKLSVTQGVLATGANFAEVEATLKEMLKSGYVSVDNDPKTGIVVFEFHELLEE
ncbi:MAG: NINE protein [Okeania sp. SIO2H7]|nr:NINE protein [Okeania sp. SIO2H7]